MNLSADMQRVVLEQRLALVATVTADGRPNVSPKGSLTVWDEHRLVFADIASPGTVENLRSNPHVEVDVVDPIVRKGYRFKGTAAVHTSGAMYEQGLAVLRARGSTLTADRVRSIVVIDVTAAAPFWSPAYDTGATEAELARRWIRHHGDLAARYRQQATTPYSDAPDGWWQAFVAALPARTAKLAVVRADGSPHVAPVWVDLDGDSIVFMTSADTIKGKAILRDPRVSLCFDDEAPPFSFVTIAGVATTSTEPAELVTWATRIGGRYMGTERAEEYGRRNAVPPEMVVRVRPTKVTAKVDIAG